MINEESQAELGGKRSSWKCYLWIVSFFQGESQRLYISGDEEERVVSSLPIDSFAMAAR
jgi:hypothetical protein